MNQPANAETIYREYEATTPTCYAARRVAWMTSDVQTRHPKTLARNALSIPSDGGIRLQWMLPTASIRLIVPANNNGEEYIYYENGDVYGVTSASPGNLADWLSWLYNEPELATHSNVSNLRSER